MMELLKKPVGKRRAPPTGLLHQQLAAELPSVASCPHAGRLCGEPQGGEVDTDPYLHDEVAILRSQGLRKDSGDRPLGQGTGPL